MGFFNEDFCSAVRCPPSNFLHSGARQRGQKKLKLGNGDNYGVTTSLPHSMGTKEGFREVILVDQWRCINCSDLNGGTTKNSRILKAFSSPQKSKKKVLVLPLIYYERFLSVASIGRVQFG